MRLRKLPRKVWGHGCLPGFSRCRKGDVNAANLKPPLVTVVFALVNHVRSGGVFISGPADFDVIIFADPLKTDPFPPTENASVGATEGVPKPKMLVHWSDLVEVVQWPGSVPLDPPGQ